MPTEGNIFLTRKTALKDHFQRLLGNQDSRTTPSVHFAPKFSCLEEEDKYPTVGPESRYPIPRMWIIRGDTGVRGTK